MISKSSIKLIQETIQNIDTLEYKPMLIYWHVDYQSKDKIDLLSVNMTGKDGNNYSQRLIVRGQIQENSEPQKSKIFSINDFDNIKPIKAEDISSKIIDKHISNSKKLIPDNCKFENIKTYRVSQKGKDLELSYDFELEVKDLKRSKMKRVRRRYIREYQTRVFIFEGKKDGLIRMK